MSGFSNIDQRLMDKINEYNHDIVPIGDRVIINKMRNRSQTAIKGVVVGVVFRDIGAKLDIFKDAMFVGCSMCMKGDVYNKALGRRIACVRAVRLARTFLNANMSYHGDYSVPYSMRPFLDDVTKRFVRIIKNGTLILPPTVDLGFECLHVENAKIVEDQSEVANVRD